MVRFSCAEACPSSLTVTVVPGGNMNLLECVPPYQHAVPALNAARIWMLLELANLDELLQAEGRTPSCAGRQEPAAMRRQASQVLLALRACYDASGGGYWRSLQEDGSAVPVRTVMLSARAVSWRCCASSPTA